MMSYDPRKIIDIALAEVGYSIKTNDGKCSKYTEDILTSSFYNARISSANWSSVFIDWCFIQAYGVEAALVLTYQPVETDDDVETGCKYSREYYDSNERLYDLPQKGDQVFFWPSNRSDPSEVSHTGLVYDVDEKCFYTVEGNTNKAPGMVTNGDGVYKKKYLLNDKRIAGFGRPEYEMGKVSIASSESKLITPQTGKKVIIITEKAVNARVGDSTEHDRVVQLGKGATLEYVATALNGWYAGRYNDQIVWISNQYSIVSNS